MTASKDFIKSVPDEGSYEATSAPWPAELRVFKEEGRLEIDFSDGRAYSLPVFSIFAQESRSDTARLNTSRPGPPSFRSTQK